MNTSLRYGLQFIAILFLFIAGSSITELPVDAEWSDWMPIVYCILIGLIAGKISWVDPRSTK